MVTYVAKSGERSEHSVEEVFQTGKSIEDYFYSMPSPTLIIGRRDIAKRLKYTKDIMYRLINIQR